MNSHQHALDSTANAVIVGFFFWKTCQKIYSKIMRMHFANKTDYNPVY
jgi:hypothetical protein